MPSKDPQDLYRRNLMNKAEEIHAKLYQEALNILEPTFNDCFEYRRYLYNQAHNLEQEEEEIFYYLCPVCGNIEKVVPEKCFSCSTLGTKFIKY